MPILTTERLHLEPIDDRHLEGLRRLNSNADVMRYITGKPETLEQTVAFIARVKSCWTELGHSWWAFIDRASGQLVGAGCIQHIQRDVANPLEIGWRLQPDVWGKGYASEAARAMAGFAFDVLATPQLLSVCQQDNADSAKVMQKLGMRYRGIERWYNVDTLVYAIHRHEWEDRANKRSISSSDLPLVSGRKNAEVTK
jgi:RimJ/RimL family protein N-acetyltransferase